jgi:hypothetical protein
MNRRRSRRRLERVLFAGCGVLLAGAILRPACGGDSSSPSGSAGSAGAAGAAQGGKSASGGTGATGGSSTGGASGSAGAPVYDGGVWQPSGDPEWTKIPWVDCGARYAKHPEHAVPPLVWQACEGGIAGCERLVINWEGKYGQSPLATRANYGGGVFKTGDGLIFVLAILAKESKTLAAYVDAKTPLGAWQGETPNGLNACGPVHLEWSSKHICQAFGGLPPLRVGLVPLGGDVNAAPIKTFKSAADVPAACNETKLFAMDTANDWYVRDLQTDAVHELGWSKGFAFTPRVHGELALVPRWTSDASNNQILEGWLWTPPNSLIKLVDATPELVYDIRTDGTTLVWLQAVSSGIDHWVPADIWVSPFTTDPTKLQPKTLGQVPLASIGFASKRIGGGYYAAVEPAKGGPSPDSRNYRLHLYRLSDGRHWELARFLDIWPGAEANTFTVPGAVLALDENEIWYEGMSQSTNGTSTVVRQRLDALGPGD